MKQSEIGAAETNNREENLSVKALDNKIIKSANENAVTHYTEMLCTFSL